MYADSHEVYECPTGKNIEKHPYVDISNTKQIEYNFYTKHEPNGDNSVKNKESEASSGWTPSINSNKEFFSFAEH